MRQLVWTETVFAAKPFLHLGKALDAQTQQPKPKKDGEGGIFACLIYLMKCPYSQPPPALGPRAARRPQMTVSVLRSVAALLQQTSSKWDQRKCLLYHQQDRGKKNLPCQRRAKNNYLLKVGKKKKTSWTGLGNYIKLISMYFFEQRLQVIGSAWTYNEHIRQMMVCQDEHDWALSRLMLEYDVGCSGFGWIQVSCIQWCAIV